MLKEYIDCCAKMRLHGVSLLRKLKARVSLTKYLSHCLIDCLFTPLVSAFCLVHLYSFTTAHTKTTSLSFSFGHHSKTYFLYSFMVALG